MDMMDYANLGSAVLTGIPAYVGAIDKEALHARNHSNELKKLISYALPSVHNLNTRIDGPVVGFTTPALTFDKMRQINGSALSLNFDIEGHVTRKAFKDAWNQWFKSWQTFFNRYQTTTGKLSTLLDSDAVAAQTESFRIQLVGDKTLGERGWIAAYESESTPENPLPPTSAAFVPSTTPKPPEKPEDGTPWWLIALFVTGGVGVVAGSFFIIRRKVIEAKQTEHFLRKDVLPIVLGGMAGPTGMALAHSATNRFAPATDPSGRGGPTFIRPLNDVDFDLDIAE